MTTVRTGRDDLGSPRPGALDAPGLDYRMWDLYHAVVLIVSGTLTVTSASGSAWQRAGAVALLLVLAAAYVGIGRRLAIRHEEATGPGLLYAFGCLVVFVLAVGLCADAAWSMASLSVQASLLLPWGYAVGTVAVLSLSRVPADALGWRPPVDDPSSLLWTALATVVASAVLTAWVDQLARQSNERAALVAELEASRGEVTRLSREAGVLAERSRLSGEIHDTLAQGYTSILTLVEAAGRTADPDRARRHLALAAEACRENLAEARAMVGALAPAPLTEHGLAGALQRLGDRLADETGADVRVEVADGPDLARPVEVVVLRAAQEALTNVGRHAEADTVAVRVERRVGAVVLTVVDDGVGLPAAAVGDGHYGLAGMRRRVEAVGGTAQVGVPATGRGTEVRVEIPVGPEGGR